MPFMPINFSKVSPIAKPVVNPLDSIVQGLTEAARLKRLPTQLDEENRTRSLRNALLQSQADIAPQMQQANLANMLARSKLTQEQAKLPYGGRLPGGLMGQIMWSNALSRRLGDDHPLSLNAKRAVEDQLSAIEGMNKYRSALSEALPKRFASSLGKELMESQQAQAGILPGGSQIDATPAMKDMINQAYRLSIQKKTSDADARKRSLFAANIDKTIDMIDPNTLVQYSGLAGAAAKKIQEGLAPLGAESDAYDNFQNELTRVQALAKQVRQFYGDSIQPQTQAELETLANPSSWLSNPKIALQKFYAFKNLLNNETKTYRDALRTIEAYREPKQSIRQRELQSIQGARTIGGKTYIKRNGEWYEQ